MDNSQLLNLYKEIYFSELTMKEQLISRMHLTIAFLFGSIGIFGYFTKTVDFSVSNNYSAVFIISYILLFCILVHCSIYFVRSWWGHSYVMLPTLRELEDYRLNLLETYKEYEDGKEIAHNHFDEQLIIKYANCAGINQLLNEKRGEYFHTCNTSLILSAIPIIVCFFTFHYGKLEKVPSQSIQPVIIMEQGTNIINSEINKEQNNGRQ